MIEFFDYKSFTLEEIDKYEFFDFECDGDTKKIMVVEKER